ncbi:MAG: hypothetical protein BWK76_15770 [Desulfobulbaceae bacterium A2]|nr:MAG: hypothetical protein BWK76_15770 [Desulfobulbaceae bacterium A2]
MPTINDDGRPQTAAERATRLAGAAFQICDLLIGRHEPAALLQGIADALAAVYPAVWVILLDEQQHCFMTSESGLGDRFAPVAALLRQGGVPPCVERVLADGRLQPCPCTPADCALCVPQPEGGPVPRLLAPLREQGASRGVLVLEMQPGEEAVAAELGLLETICRRLGRGLDYVLELAACDMREETLRKSEERLQLALYASQAGLWDWNLVSGEIYTNPYRPAALDYRTYHPEGTLESRDTWQALIHPEDKPRVLEVLGAHLAGRSEDYRIEYRVRAEDGSWHWYFDRGKVVERDERGMPLRMTGTHLDVTEQKLRDKELAEAQERLHQAVAREREFLQMVINGAGDPVLVMDLDYQVLLMNESAQRILGIAPGSSLDRPCFQLFCQAERPCDDLRFPCPIRAVREGGRRMTLVHNPYHGHPINNTYELEVSPLVGEGETLLGVIEVARDITDRLRIEEQLRENESHLYRLAHHDALTGLPNRLLFHDRLEQSIAKARRYDHRVAILFLDLDRFKFINDTLGHDVGDELLVEVARRLQGQCRRSDTVARLGGDEFVFILDDIVNVNDVVTVVGKIMESLTRSILAGGQELFIGTSIGIGLFPDDAKEIDEVIKCADIALYRAKDEGRGTYRFYTPDMNTRAERLLQMETWLRRALEKNQFELVYQPRFQVADNTLCGMEALLRWHHPKRGLLTACDFIALAEETGLVLPLGQWVFDTACRQLAAWQRAGLHLVPLAVNVTARQFQQRDFCTMVADAAAVCGTPALLEIELGENTVMSQVEEAAASLDCLAAAGFRLTLDDFGLGRSSLQYLKRFPLHGLRIAQLFLKDALVEPNVAKVMEAIILLARSLDLTVLAKGVEDEQQLLLLRRLGCDQAQGFHLAPPLSVEEMGKLLR